MYLLLDVQTLSALIEIQFLFLIVPQLFTNNSKFHINKCSSVHTQKYHIILSKILYNIQLPLSMMY